MKTITTTITCDHCESAIDQGSAIDVILPEELTHRNFCSERCASGFFWKRNPDIKDEPLIQALADAISALTPAERDSIAATYGQLLEASGPLAIKCITHQFDYGSSLGLGYSVKVGDKQAKQAVSISPNLVKQEHIPSIIAAIMDYLRSPDSRLRIGPQPMTGYEMEIECDADGKCRIAPAHGALPDFERI